MPDINTVATVASGVVGALLGSFATYLGRERSRKNEKREEIETLRRSLVAELASMEELATIDSANKPTKVPIHRLVSSEVYKSNSPKISRLTPREAEAVIRFYSNAIRYEQTLDTTHQLLSNIDASPLHDMSPLHISRDLLRKEWKDCVLALISELDDYPGEIKIDGERYSVDESMSSADIWYVLNLDKLETDDIERIQ